MAVGDRTLPRYGHRFSRHDFQLSQLFACLVLRKFFRTDYRGIVAILADWPQMREHLRLNKTPHFTTLQKAEERLLTDPLTRKLLTQTVAAFHEHGPATADAPMEAYVIEIAAADSTGLMLDHASRYFIRRRSRAPNLWQTTTYRRFGKLAIVVDCDTHLILATYCGIGPRPDIDELKPLLDGICTNAVPERLLADGGYDSQHNHRLLREEYEIESLIPAVHGRPTNALPTNRWRWLMAVNFDDETYGQRWQVETVMFMIKRHQGAGIGARTDGTRRREMALMAITHNIMIVLPEELFYRACQEPLFDVPITPTSRDRHKRMAIVPQGRPKSKRIPPARGWAATGAAKTTRSSGTSGLRQRRPPPRPLRPLRPLRRVGWEQTDKEHKEHSQPV